MKRLFICMILLLAFSAPALAQNSSADPAAYLPGDLAAYVEIRTDEAGINALNQLFDLGYRLSGVAGAAPVDAIDTLGSLLPGINLRTDVLPWLGDRIGVGLPSLALGGSDAARESIFALPVRDAAAAQAFVSKISAGATAESVGGVNVYKTASIGLASGTDVIWLSSPQGIDTLLKNPMLVRLTDNRGYQQVRAALPTDAVLDLYLSGTFLTDALAQTQQNNPPGQPSLGVIAEAALRLHPATSALEDALLKAPSVNGIGFALQVGSDRIDGTGVLSINAQYPAPTLTTATAGTALLNLIPGDSFAVFDSYDVSIMAIPVAALVYLGPVIGSTFQSIVVNLEGTPMFATPTPTPTPTPAPPVTADALIAQVQPIIKQAESTMGLSLDQLYGLIDGEYALAAFPGPGPTIGAALYLQSSDPQRLIDTMDHVSKLILTDPAAGTPLVAIEHKTVSGLDVALLGEPSVSDRPAVGILNGNVLFLTMESSLPKVIGGAANQSPATPALNWRDAFGASQAALFYVDPRTVDLYNLRMERNPPLPLSALAGSFNVQADGLFVLHLAATIGS